MRLEIFNFQAGDVFLLLHCIILYLVLFLRLGYSLIDVHRITTEAVSQMPYHLHTSASACSHERRKTPEDGGHRPHGRERNREEVRITHSQTLLD